MKFSISLDQRNYLQQTGYIPFYQLLSDAEIKLLNEGVQQTLKLKTAKTMEPSSYARDLWRLNDAVKQIVFSKRLVNVVYELTHKKPIRLAFDQFIPEITNGRFQQEETKAPLSHFLEKDVPLQERSSVNPLVGMFLLVLNTDESVDEEQRIGKGGGYFILPTASFSLDELPLSPNQQFLLIGYGDMHSQYLYEVRDPQVHFLKSLGYVFGDKLNDRLHPVLLR